MLQLFPGDIVVQKSKFLNTTAIGRIKYFQPVAGKPLDSGNDAMFGNRQIHWKKSFEAPKVALKYKILDFIWRLKTL